MPSERLSVSCYEGQNKTCVMFLYSRETICRWMGSRVGATVG